jgi:acyl dehydratase
MSVGENTEARPGALRAGSVLAAVEYPTSTVQIFRYSAATWNTHRIHYDKAYAVAEGYPDVLVQSHLHGAFLARYCTDWIGAHGRLLELGLRVRRFAIAGETLSVTGTVTTVERLDDAHAAIALELIETRGSDNEACATGAARIEIPLEWLASDAADDPGEQETTAT